MTAFIMSSLNPPFNDASDRLTPDALKAQAHAMTDGLFESWVRTAGAIMIPGGQLSLIARPQSIGEIIAACGRRFGGIEITPIHPREGENAVRILVTAIKGSRARLALRAPLIMHGEGTHKFSDFVDDLNNGRAAYSRKERMDPEKCDAVFEKIMRNRRIPQNASKISLMFRTAMMRAMI